MAVLVQRQLVPDLFSGLLPSKPTPTEDPSIRSAGLTSSESVTSTNSLSSPATIISTPTVISTPAVISPSQTSSTPASSESISTESSLTPSSTIASSTSAAPTTTATPTPVPIVTTSPDGSAFTVTISSSASPSASVQAVPDNTANGFLQNKTTSGIVFAVVGVVAFILIVAIATIAVRRSKRRRLQDEAVSFDPVSLGGSPLDRDSVEKRRFSLLSSDNGHGGIGSNHSHGGYISSAPAPSAYSRPDPYRYPASESQHSLVNQAQQPWYGGAGVNRSYGVAHAPQSELRPAWAYGNDSAPYPPSQTFVPSGRAESPESAPYLRAGNLKIAHA